MSCGNNCENCECDEDSESHACEKTTEVYSRIVGYFRPVENWNEGKKQEFCDRKEYSPKEAIAPEIKSD